MSQNCASKIGARNSTESSFAPSRANGVTSNAWGMNMSATSPILRPFRKMSQSVSSPSNSSTAFSSGAIRSSVNERV